MALFLKKKRVELLYLVRETTSHRGANVVIVFHILGQRPIRTRQIVTILYLYLPAKFSAIQIRFNIAASY